MKTIDAFRKKTIVILALLVVITMTMSCSDESLTDEITDVPEMTTADLTVGTISTFTSFDPYKGEFPESIAVDHFGNIYVSMIRITGNMET
jgi:hypothetical protein